MLSTQEKRVLTILNIPNCPLAVKGCAKHVPPETQKCAFQTEKRNRLAA